MAGRGKTTKLEIQTPDRTVLSEEVSAIRVELADGWRKGESITGVATDYEDTLDA